MLPWQCCRNADLLRRMAPATGRSDRSMCGADGLHEIAPRCCILSLVPSSWMVVHSVSFDDDSDEDLCVFSGTDLLTTHYDVAELAWEEIAERALIDERRGLVVTQVAVLEDLVDEFLLYLEDPPNVGEFRAGLDTKSIGPRLDMLEARLLKARLLDEEASHQMAGLRAAVARRNRLAHGTIHCRPTRAVPINDLSRVELEIEWVLVDRRSRAVERISMAGLRQDLDDAIGAFSALLAYAEVFVERVPEPVNFVDGIYLGGLPS